MSLTLNMDSGGANGFFQKWYRYLSSTMNQPVAAMYTALTETEVYAFTSSILELWYYFVKHAQF